MTQINVDYTINFGFFTGIVNAYILALSQNLFSFFFQFFSTEISEKYYSEANQVITE